MLISTLNCTTRVSILVFECHQLEIGASFNDTWQGDRVVKGGFLLPNLVEGVTPGGGGGGGRLGRLQTAGGTGPVNPSSSYKHQDMVSRVYWSIYVDDVASVTDDTLLTS